MSAALEPAVGGESRARRPWLAFLLSLLAPGLGHLYAGGFRRALSALLAWTVIAGTSVWLFSHPFGRIATWVAMVLLVSALLGIPIHAAMTARSGSPLRVGRRWLRVVLYVLYLVAFSEASTRAASWIRADLAEPFRVPSAAMFPTLQVGDDFFADKTAYVDRSPQRGDVVVFWVALEGGRLFPADLHPDLPRAQLVKRIVGVPGDRVRVSGSSVFLNGAAIPSEHFGSANESNLELELYSESLGRHLYRIARDPTVIRPDLPETVVPPGRYFVMGDNRDHSNDSRSWGTVSRADIVAKASHLYFSRHPSNGSIDWARIGTRVE